MQYLKDWHENTIPLLNELRVLAPEFDKFLRAASESFWKIDRKTVESYEQESASPPEKPPGKPHKLMCVLSDCLDTFENIAIAYEVRPIERRVVHESLARMMLNA